MCFYVLFCVTKEEKDFLSSSESMCVINRCWMVSMSCPVLQEDCVIGAATLLKGKCVKIYSNSHGVHQSLEIS